MITKHATLRTRIICLFLVFVSFQQHTTAQYYRNTIDNMPWELDLNVGPTIFLGDVGGGRGKGAAFVKDINLASTKFVYGLNLSYFPNNWLGIRGGFNIGKLAGFDSLIASSGGIEKSRKDRNLGFRSNISEGFLAVEFYPTVLFANEESIWSYELRPYFGIGLGFVNFNPQGEYVDPATGMRGWIDLRPLRLEGQGMAEYPFRKEYATTALQVPVMLGVKYFLDEKWYVGCEVQQRFTFTDYIDDVSTTYIDPAMFSKYLSPVNASIAEQMMFKRRFKSSRPISNFIGKDRGNSGNKDYYLSVFIKLGFRFGDRNANGYGYVL